MPDIRRWSGVSRPGEKQLTRRRHELVDLKLEVKLLSVVDDVQSVEGMNLMAR